MGKIEVSALIKAIQESVSLLVSDGIAPRERITDPVNDAARVQDLESGYSTEIDDIVDNIPDVPPAPTLPTVELATYYTGNYVTNCSPGGFLNIYDGANLVPYDSTKTHIARVSDGHGGWLEWQFSCIEYAGDFAIKNMTSDTLSTYAVRLFSCSSTQAEIIYVYNSSNEKYQAFKFTLNETVYYYVADSVQNDWTDDLSSIGYSLEPVSLLPTVTANVAYASTEARVYVFGGDSVNLYTTLSHSSGTIPYDSTKSYGGRVGDGDGGVSTWQFLFINNSGYLAIKNTTSTGIYAFGLDYYICSSNQAEIVFVLNSSNVKYQAFKYTQDGTDYYYVLDGVQSDWTDDLSSIGYSLEPPAPTVPVVNIYLNPNTNMYFQSNVTNRVRKKPGNMYQLYADDTLQTPYIFDWGKRYEKGYINSETGEWVAQVRQNQSDVPAVKGDSLSLSLLANISDSASTIGMLWLLSTTSSSGYTRYGQIAVKIYDDATSYWLNGNHTDQAATSTYLTDIDYDSSKIYKVLAFVKENGNRDYDEYLYALNFYNNSGKLKIILSTYTSSMRFARIVLHAKNKEIYTGYFNAGDGNSEKSVTNAWAASGDQINGVYPLNSDTGYQYRSAQYKILSVFYADGTTVTDETLAPYSISSSVVMVSNPYVSGLLSIRTMVNNKILGNPCGCTFRMELTLYFNRNNPGVNTSMYGSTSDSIQWVRLYAQNTTGGSGTEVSYDPSKVYKVLGVYREDGTQIESTFMMGNSSNYLRLCIINGGTEWIGAKVVYTEA